jgi:hypothetical protein
MSGIAFVLSKLERYDESLKIYEMVYEEESRVFGCGHTRTLETLYNIANKQYIVGRHDEAHFTASRCLELARKNGFEGVAARCVEIISLIDEARDDADPTLTDEQKRIRGRIRLKKQQDREKVEAVAEAAPAAKSKLPVKEVSVDDLMLQFGLEDDDGGGKASSNGGGSKQKKKKGGKGKK